MIRFLIAAFVWLLFGLPASAAFVQGTSNNSAGTSVASLTLTLGAGVTTGNCVWGIVTTISVGGTTMTATLGGVSMTVMDALPVAGPNVESWSFILGNVSGAPTSLVFTPGASGPLAAIAIEESGCAALANPTDVHTAQTQVVSVTGANSLTSGNVTTTVANDIIVGAAMNTGGTGAPTVGTSPLAFTLRNTTTFDTFAPVVTEDNVVLASPGTAAATFGTSATQTYNAYVIAIKPLVVGHTTQDMTVLGVGR